jgi:hypothetical protein
MATHEDVQRALGQTQWQALIKSKLPLPVTNSLLAIWLEGWPTKFKKMVSANQILPMLLNLRAPLETAQESVSDPHMQHLAMHEHLEMAGLPLKL